MNDPNSSKKTNFKHSLEILLSKAICDLYSSLLGHRPTLVMCRFLTNKELTLVFENFLTPIENMLVLRGCESLATQVRQNIDLAFHSQLKRTIEEYTKKSVVDILSESRIGTGRKSIILVFDSTLTLS